MKNKDKYCQTYIPKSLRTKLKTKAWCKKMLLHQYIEYIIVKGLENEK